MSQNIRMLFILKNQNKKDKVEKIAKLIATTLEIEDNSILAKYHKFENSFEILFRFQLESESNLSHKLIELTDRVCSPWIVYFDKHTEQIELIFNQTETSRSRKKEFNNISWASVCVGEE